jgi:cytochrome c-type protein NapC
VGVVGFEYGMAATSNEKLCTSCHVMADNAALMLEGTTHFSNASGVRPTCSDCHIPEEFGPRMIRMIHASRWVWGNINGIIDTPEKYVAHAPKMKEREISRLRANDSQECRNCHDVKQMNSAQQSTKAQSFHKVLGTGKRTCIDCHAGLTHTPPEQVSQAVSRP